MFWFQIDYYCSGELVEESDESSVSQAESEGEVEGEKKSFAHVSYRYLVVGGIFAIYL